MINLSEKLGEMTFDGLITDIKPAPEVRGGVIRKLSAAATLKRGTILAKSSGTAGDGKLVVLGTAAVSNETLTPDCILCDDIEVGTAVGGVSETVFTAGASPSIVMLRPSLPAGAFWAGAVSFSTAMEICSEELSSVLPSIGMTSVATLSVGWDGERRPSPPGSDTSPICSSNREISSGADDPSSAGDKEMVSSSSSKVTVCAAA